MSDTPDESEVRPTAETGPIEDAAATAESTATDTVDTAGAADGPAADAVADRLDAVADDAAADPAAVGAEPVSDLDAAIDRASALEAPEAEAAVPAEVDADAVLAADTGAETAVLPEPIAAESARRETFVPPTAVAPPPPLPQPVPQPLPQTVYVQAPAAPRNLGNRGFGTLVALVATVAFAALYLGIGALLLLGAGGPSVAGDLVAQFATRPVYWVPIIAFFVGFVVLVAIVNRGRWWAYVVFGLLVGAFVYASYVGGAMLTVQLWKYTFDEAVQFISQRWLDPFAIVAGLVAREVVIWFGAWVARHGAVVEQRNRDAYSDYERVLAAGPNAVR